MKTKNNNVLYILGIILCFVIFDLITAGVGNVKGILKLITTGVSYIYTKTYYGQRILGELLWLLSALGLIFVFKKNYIFKEKKKTFLSTLLLSWPLLLQSIIFLISSIVNIDYTVISGYEVIALLIYMLLVGLFEEFFCRGWLLNSFLDKIGKDRKGVIISIVLSSLVFGLWHIMNIFQGQGIYTTYTQVIFAFIMGIAFGAIYYKSKNIWAVAFLHGLWDFSIMLGEVNISTSCFEIATTETLSFVLIVIGLFSVIFSYASELIYPFLLLDKASINTELGHEVTKEDTEKHHIKKIVISAIILILLLFDSSVINTRKYNYPTCPTYYDMTATNYTETVVNNTSYQLYLSGNIYNFNIVDKQLVINNTILAYSEVKNFAIIANDNTYSVIILVYKSGEYITYYSDYLKSGITVDLNEFAESFTQVMLPSTISKIGYYEDSTSTYKYPLFINSNDTRYILDENGTIYKYKTK